MKISYKSISIVFLLVSFQSCEEEEEPDEFYVFQPNAYYMIADGVSKLYLEVNLYDRIYNVTRITEGDSFYYNGTLLRGNTFTTTEAGDHKFRAQYKNWTSKEITIKARPVKEYDLITIPIIFHILFNNEPIGQGANISQQEIIDVVENINQRFKNTYYTINHPNVIQSPNHVDTKIQFRLAQYDPQGNLLEEPGIKRYGGYDSNEWETNEPQYLFMSQNTWQPYNYINICIANHNLGSGATLPVSTSTHSLCFLEITDESWEEYQLRTEGFHGLQWSLNSFYGGRDLTHDLGHIFGLHHNFDKGCNMERHPNGKNDCVEDTQFYNESDFKLGHMRQVYTECETGNFMMHDNYMDYYRHSSAANLNTYYGFTYDQRDRMREVLEYSPWIKELKNSTK